MTSIIGGVGHHVLQDGRRSYLLGALLWPDGSVLECAVFSRLA